MSNLALLGLVVAVLVLAGVLLAILAWDRKTPPEEPIDDPLQLQIWNEAAAKARADFGLAGTRAVGEKWAASIAAILGILSTVAFVAGPDALVEDVGGAEAAVAAILILLAAGVAAVATLLAALAEHGTPVYKQNLTGPLYRTLIRTRAEKASRQVRASRLLVVVALVLIVGATGVAWLTALTGEEGAAKQSALVVGASGAKCGDLTLVGQTVALAVNGKVEAIPNDARVTLVGSCPK